MTVPSIGPDDFKVVEVLKTILLEFGTEIAGAVEVK